MVSAEVSLQEFVSKQKRLLELELRSEEEGGPANTRQNDDGDYVLRNLDVADTSVGLYGRTVVSFESTSQNTEDTKTPDSLETIDLNKSARLILPAHRLTVGDEVEILPRNGKGASRRSKDSQDGRKPRRSTGVVSAVDDYTISVALSGGKSQNGSNKTRQKQDLKMNAKETDDGNDDDDLLGGSPPYSLVPRSNVEVHHKMVFALEEMEKYGVNHPISGSIIMAAFEPNSVNAANMSQVRKDELDQELNLSSSRLDHSQKEAVMFALESDCPITCLHGPPGTGGLAYFLFDVFS